MFLPFYLCLEKKGISLHVKNCHWFQQNAYCEGNVRTPRNKMRDAFCSRLPVSVSLAKFAPLQCVLGHCQTPPTDFMVVPDLLESEGFLP